MTRRPWNTGRVRRQPTRYLRCPGCDKFGVTLRLGREDWFVCRYCQWSAANHREDEALLQELRLLNPNNPHAPD